MPTGQLGGQGATGERQGPCHALTSPWNSDFTSYMQLSTTKVTQQGSSRALHPPLSFPSPLRSCWQEQQRRLRCSHFLPPVITVSASFHPKKNQAALQRGTGCPQQLCITSPAPAQSRKTRTRRETRCSVGMPCPHAPKGEPETPRMHKPTDAEAAAWPPQELRTFQEARGNQKKKKKPSLLTKHSTNKRTESSPSPASGTHPACPPR